MIYWRTMLFQGVIQFPYHMEKVRSQDLMSRCKAKSYFSMQLVILRVTEMILQSGKTFYAKLYGSKQMIITSLNELRFQLFTSRKTSSL